MKPASDWADALAALRGTMPGDDAEPQEQDIPAEATGNDKAEVSSLTATLCYERKGRGGKPATIITGLDGLGQEKLLALASGLKKALATGGSARGGEILVQGDRRDELRRLLAARGFKVKG